MSEPTSIRNELKQKQSSMVFAKDPLRAKQQSQQHYGESIFAFCGTKNLR